MWETCLKCPLDGMKCGRIDFCPKEEENCRCKDCTPEKPLCVKRRDSH